MKFGGTSLANAERIKNVAEIVKTKLDKSPLVVVSAVSGITNKLLDLAKNSAKKVEPSEKFNEIKEIHEQIIENLGLNKNLLEKDLEKLYDTMKGIYLLEETSLRTLDLVASFGEIFSSKILSEYLNLIQIKSKQYCGWEIGIITDDNFTNAEILQETYKNIKSNLSNLDSIPIITGFIAKNKKNEITTLGRGGSDYTASIIGAGLKVDEIEIWTDVSGIKTADPRIVKNAKQWEKVTFNEASEMAYFGAKVLHPKTIKPAVDNEIPVRVLNTYEPENPGTLIVKEDPEECVFRAVSSKDNLTVLKIASTKMFLAHGFLANVFNILDKHKISVDLVSTSEVTVSFTLDNINGSFENLESALTELKKFSTVEILKQRAIICIVGKDIPGKTGILGKIFNICKNYKIDVELVSQGASPISISFVVKQEEAPLIIRELHRGLFEENDNI